MTRRCRTFRVVIVQALGSDVDQVAVGDEVLVAPGISCWACRYCQTGDDNLCEQYKIIGAGTQGGFAELVAVPARNLIQKPSSVSFEAAAAFPLTFLTAWHMLITLAHLQKGQDVLVMAAGSGVGAAAVQIAKHHGARVIAAAGSQVKLDKAKSIGADEVINYNEVPAFQTQVQDMTGGRGVDVVFEHIGPATWTQSMASLGTGGVLVTCGATTGPEVTTDLRYMFMRQLSICGSLMGTRRELDDIVPLVSSGVLQPAIDVVMPLSEARAAQEHMLDRKQFGKILLTP